MISLKRLTFSLALAGLLSSCFSNSAPAINETPSFSATDPFSESTEIPSITQTHFVTPTGAAGNLDLYLDWLFSINFTEDCRLPCWWGIHPGLASLPNVKEVLSPLGLFDFPAPDNFPPGYELLGLSIDAREVQHISMGLWATDSVLERLHVTLGPFSMTSERSDFVNNYAVDSIIREYGPPSQILVGLVTIPPESALSWEYDLWLVYEKEGILIHYTGPYQLPKGDDEFISVCFSLDNGGFINLNLRPPVDDLAKIPVFSLGVEVDIKNGLLAGELLSWQEASGETIEHFVDRFSAPNNNFCLDFATELWQ